jgi:hypothetical protein
MTFDWKHLMCGCWGLDRYGNDVQHFIDLNSVSFAFATDQQFVFEQLCQYHVPEVCFRLKEYKIDFTIFVFENNIDMYVERL